MADLALQADETLLWEGAPHRASQTAVWYGLFGLSILGVLSAPAVYAIASNDMTVFDHVNFTLNGERITSETPIETMTTVVLWLTALAAVWIITVVIWRALSIRETYALSDKRVIIQKPLLPSRVASIPISTIWAVERSGGQEVGSVMFYGRDPSMIDRLMALYQVPPNKFLNIRNPSEVEALLLDAIAQCRKDVT